MPAECHPVTVLPGTTRLFREFTQMRSLPQDAEVRHFYAADPFSDAWQHSELVAQPDRPALVEELRQQNSGWGAGPATMANLDRLAEGARAVVTGQQVALFGGPLLTLLKAATAIRKARIASEAGVPHVPIFWMATEDHDLDEVNQATFAGKAGVTTLRSSFPGHGSKPVGDLALGDAIEPVLAAAEELLQFAPVTELLRASYTPGDTLASAFAKFISGVFREHGLIVIDASSRQCHAMGSDVLRHAIEHADALHAALVERSALLESHGYHAQVLVPPGGSLLFLLDEGGNRLPLRRLGGDRWKAGAIEYGTRDLLELLDAAPERLSPNALLRPVFQDAILPTAAYVAGPAEVAYFAQSQVIYQQVLGRMTTVVPRLSATLVPAAVRTVMDRFEITFEAALATPEDLAQRLGARMMPVEGKRALSSAGNALDAELETVTKWMQAMDADLGRSAGVAANKMRYQMNRLRRLAANWQLQKNTHLRKQAELVTNMLYPNGHPQERLLSGAALLGLSSVDLAGLLVDNAAGECPGHRVLNI